jgi:hypothetical protein
MLVSSFREKKKRKTIFINSYALEIWQVRRDHMRILKEKSFLHLIQLPVLYRTIRYWVSHKVLVVNLNKRPMGHIAHLMLIFFIRHSVLHPGKTNGSQMAFITYTYNYIVKNACIVLLIMTDDLFNKHFFLYLGKENLLIWYTSGQQFDQISGFHDDIRIPCFSCCPNCHASLYHI